VTLKHICNFFSEVSTA